MIVNPPYAASEPPQMPAGLLSICAVLEEAGHEVRVVDLLVGRRDRATVERALEEFRPTMVGVTSVTMNWPEASRILRWVKATDPHIATVAGGPHVTFTWRQIGLHEPWVDYVILGEGEKTIIELVNGTANGGRARGIAGLAWREGGQMEAGPPRPLQPDINAFPTPARHLFPLSRYRAIGAGIGVSTGRGCPFSCIFCVGPKMVGRRPRLRAPSAVADEIEQLVKGGVSEVSFTDDHFGMKRSHALAICDEILSRGIDVEFSAFIRADAADPELLKRMQQAGCTRILYGAESGVQEIVDRVRKKTDLEMLKDKVKLALDMGFQIQVSFILGLPGETLDTVRQTFAFAYSLGGHAGLHVLAPMPGSEVCERAEELGIRILHEDWSLYDANHVVTETPGLSAAELSRIVAEMNENNERFDQMAVEQWKKGELSGWRLRNLERRRRMDFFFPLLRSGFFDGEEGGATVPGDADPLDALVRSAALEVGVDEAEAARWIGEVMDTGDLQLIRGGSASRFAFREDLL